MNKIELKNRRVRIIREILKRLHFRLSKIVERIQNYEMELLELENE